MAESAPPLMSPHRGSAKLAPIDGASKSGDEIGSPSAAAASKVQLPRTAPLTLAPSSEDSAAPPPASPSAPAPAGPSPAPAVSPRNRPFSGARGHIAAEPPAATPAPNNGTDIPVDGFGAAMATQMARSAQLHAAYGGTQSYGVDDMPDETPAHLAPVKRRGWLACCFGSGGGHKAVAPEPPQDPNKRVWDLPPMYMSREDMQQKALMLMNEPNVKAAFQRFDADGSGSVDAKEIEQILKAANAEISPDELDAMLKRLDKDGSGELDLQELCVFLLERRDELQTQKDIKELLGLSFSGQVPGLSWGGGGASGLDTTVGVAELKAVFMRKLPHQATLSDAEFEALLTEVGLTADSTETISLATLAEHPAFEAGPVAPPTGMSVRASAASTARSSEGAAN